MDYDTERDLYRLDRILEGLESSRTQDERLRAALDTIPILKSLFHQLHRDVESMHQSFGNLITYLCEGSGENIYMWKESIAKRLIDQGARIRELEKLMVSEKGAGPVAPDPQDPEPAESNTAPPRGRGRGRTKRAEA